MSGDREGMMNRTDATNPKFNNDDCSLKAALGSGLLQAGMGWCMFLCRRGTKMRTVLCEDHSSKHGDAGFWRKTLGSRTA